MPDLVKLTIDGKPVEVPAGTLVINAARQAGIEVPAFCYYEGLTLQAACRMCLVEVEKAPKLLTACTLPVAQDMVVRTETPKVAEARKGMLEFLLTNHPLDCPVCDKGGECELQDMVFRYGAGESRFTEEKIHEPEKQWSPVVYYDMPRCILCFRCVRICDEGMGVRALGIVSRGAYSEIAPNLGDRLECDECGMCIDICPVGALTSGAYRYKTRPWEMEYVGTVCTHCGDGCKTTLSVRNGAVIRANNRDHSGINGEFLCIKGRYAFDFLTHPDRLREPLVRQNGKLEPAGWAEAIRIVAEKFREVRDRGGSFGVIGSARTTNEENFYLQRFARQYLRTPHIDHRRSGDIAALAAAGARGATSAELYRAAAVLIIGADLSQQHPFLAFQVRANVRHHGARVYVVNPEATREEARATRVVRERGLAGVERIREILANEANLVVLFGDHVQGEDVQRLVEMLSPAARYICLLDYANSRGAYDMGLTPDAGGMTIDGMTAAAQDGSLDVLWVVGANPLEGVPAVKSFLVVQELFLTETAQLADVVLPAAAAYEKTGSFTNTCGEVQRLRKGPATPGVKSDLEIMSLIARRLGHELAAPLPETVFEEIRRTVPGYNVPYAAFVSGAAVPAALTDGRPQPGGQRIASARDTLFQSGTLGRYCPVLQAVPEKDRVQVRV
jgi:NADH-quinone oxidoreductase subunit G